MLMVYSLKGLFATRSLGLFSLSLRSGLHITEDGEDREGTSRT